MITLSNLTGRVAILIASTELALRVVPQGGWLRASCVHVGLTAPVILPCAGELTWQLPSLAKGRARLCSRGC